MEGNAAATSLYADASTIGAQSDNLVYPVSLPETCPLRLPETLPAHQQKGTSKPKPLNTMTGAEGPTSSPNSLG